MKRHLSTRTSATCPRALWGLTHPAALAEWPGHKCFITTHGGGRDSYDGYISPPVTPEHHSVRSQKPQRARNQSDKTELSQCVCIETENRHLACPSVCLSSLRTSFISSFLPTSCPLYLAFILSCLLSNLDFHRNPFRFTLLSSLLLFNSFLFVIHSFLSSCLLPPPLRPSCVSWSVLCTHSAPCGSSLVCCRCLDSAETIRFVLNAASHWAPTLIGVSTQAGFHLPAQMWLCLLPTFRSNWDLMNR